MLNILTNGSNACFIHGLREGLTRQFPFGNDSSFISTFSIFWLIMNSILLFFLFLLNLFSLFSISSQLNFIHKTKPAGTWDPPSTSLVPGFSTSSGSLSESSSLYFRPLFFLLPFSSNHLTGASEPTHQQLVRWVINQVKSTSGVQYYYHRLCLDASFFVPGD